MLARCILWLLAAMLLAGCGTTAKTAGTTETHERTALTVKRDSAVVRDSVAIRYETIVKDSTVVRDSVVLTVDKDGTVLNREHYRNTDRNREQTTGKTNESSHEVQQSDTVRQTNSDVLNHWGVKTEEKSSGVPWYVCFAAGALAAGALLYIYNKGVKLWK